jgi:hypothetical protein
MSAISPAPRPSSSRPRRRGPATRLGPGQPRPRGPAAVISSASASCASRARGRSAYALLQPLDLLPEEGEVAQVPVTSASSVFRPVLIEPEGEVRSGSSQTAPASVFPNFTPDAVVMSGKTAPKALPPVMRPDELDAPTVMFPHWSLPPNWKRHAVILEEPVEVVRLEEQVAELRVAQPRPLVLQASADALLPEHHVHREVLAHVAEEVQDRHVPSHSRLSTSRAGFGTPSKSRKASSCARTASALAATSFVVRRFRSSDFPEGSPMRPGPSAHQRDGGVAGALEVHEAHDGEEVPHVEGGGCGVESHVRRLDSLGEGGFRPFGHVLEHPAPAVFVEERARSHGGGPACRGQGRRCHGGVVGT